MSLEQFRKFAEKSKFRRPDSEWSVRWLKRLYEFAKQSEAETLRMDADGLITFLRMLRDRGVPAWRRHQAAVVLARYLSMFGEVNARVLEVVSKLADMATAERKGDEGAAKNETHFPKGEPEIVTEMRKTLRRRRYKFDTEKAYVGWVVRFLAAHPGRSADSMGEPEIRKFLSDLATDPRGGVAASTLKQAKSALLFLYQQVLNRELAYLDHSEATKPVKLPVVLTRNEVEQLRKNMSGMQRLMFDLMYGAGLRHKECRSLRIKDIQLEEGTILVRDGKGEKDRITVLPTSIRQELLSQMERCRKRHQLDLEMGGGDVFLPDALARKYPNESRKFGWQWLFPSHRIRQDPRTGRNWRHHVSEDFLAKPFAKALLTSGCSKNAVPHSLRNERSCYCSSLRTGYSKGNSACWELARGSWRPLCTAVIAV